MKKQTEVSPEGVPPQELAKYNRESGKKTLYFVGVLIAIVAVLTIVTLILFKMGA